MIRQEQVIQKAVVGHLKLRAVPGLVWWHAPMGMHAANRFQGAIMKALGARAGVSDLILVHQGRIFALELKAEGNRANESQLEFLADMEKQGAFCAIATGIDQALATLEAWQLLRGSSVRAA
jgi:hypothetical protein